MLTFWQHLSKKTYYCYSFTSYLFGIPTLLNLVVPIPFFCVESRNRCCESIEKEKLLRFFCGNFRDLRDPRDPEKPEVRAQGGAGLTFLGLGVS